MGIVKVTRDMVDAALKEVDWAAIDAMTDEDIEEQVRQNPDAAPILTDAYVLWRVAR
jgi:putative transcriptional regulator